MSPRLEPLEVRRLLSTIAGTVFDDADSSGTFDVGETGISNRTVYLDTNNNGSKDNGETFLQTQNDGTYIFQGLSAGTYHVRQVVPFGFQQTTPLNGDGYDITLVDGQDVENTDFGTVAVPVITGSIAGTVYDDASGDGVLDNGEVGVAGRTVYLDSNNNGSLDLDETFTTTDVDGSYLFDLIEIKSYAVRTELPQGWRQTVPANNAALNVTLTNLDKDQISKDFLTTNKPIGSFSGVVYLDANRDGIKDTGENGISGIVVFLDTNDNGDLDNGELTRTTDNSGAYAFNNIDTGTYNVVQVLQANWLQTQPAANQPWVVTLTPDDNIPDIDFGTATIPGSITGTVFNDANENGVNDNGESGVAGRTVYLDTNNNKQLDNGEQTATTDVNGVYVFDEVEIQAYNVRTVLPQGYLQTAPANGASQTVTLTGNNRDVTDIDFQTVLHPVGSFTGTVYRDLNRNRAKDNGEPGVSGITVYIDANNNNVFDNGEQSQVTNGSGVYTFSNLDVGDYTVRQVLQTNWVQTAPIGNQPRLVTVIVDTTLQNIDFGTAPIPGNIAGTVFEDANGNGKLDAGEKGLGGIQVYIDANRNGSFDNGETTQTVASSGAYNFRNLDPGQYLVRVVAPSGYRITTAAFYDLTLVAAQSITGKVFGLTARGTIQGSVFSDANTNRARDVGEVGLRGWKIYIDANDNGRFDAGEKYTLTDANGDYKFENITAGTYKIRAVQQSKYKLTTPIVGYYTANLSASGTAGGLVFGEKLV